MTKEPAKKNSAGSSAIDGSTPTLSPVHTLASLLAHLDAAVNGRLQIRLPGLVHLVPRHIRPRLLIPHAPAGEDRDLQIGATKTTITHG